MISIPGKIPIYIHPVFWLFAVLIGWLNSMTIPGTVIWTLVIVFSVLIHEFGHALTALAFGQNAHIELVGMGGVTQRSGKNLKLWQEFIIVFNGPLAGFLLFLGTYFLQKKIAASASPLLLYTIDITVYANLFWTFVNLLPIQPLDGGRLLTIILEGMFGVKGLKISLFLSMIFSALVAILFFSLQSLLAGSLFLFFTFESYRSWKNSLTIIKEDRDTVLQDVMKQAEQDIREGRVENALADLQQLRDSTKTGILYFNATQEMAKIYYQQSKFREAYDLLESVKKKLTNENLKLLHQLAYRTGNINEVIALGGEVYQIYPTYDTALINSLAAAKNGDVQSTVGWMQCAIRDGLPNVNAIMDKTEFDSIRKNPTFQNFLKDLSGKFT